MSHKCMELRIGNLMNLSATWAPNQALHEVKSSAWRVQLFSKTAREFLAYSYTDKGLVTTLHYSTHNIPDTV